MPRLPPTAPWCASLALAFILCGTGALGQQPDEQERIGLRSTLHPAAKAQAAASGATAGARGEAGTTIGSPPGSGAGTTGFVSTNVPTRGTRTAKQAAAPKAAPAATAARPGSDPRDVIGSSPRRRPRRGQEEDDPYGQLGLRVGSFTAKPSVELSAGHDDNPFRTAGGRGSRLTVAAVRVETESNWPRHALASELRGRYTKYLDVDNNDRPEAEAKLRGRIDVNALSRVELEGRAALTIEPAGSPDAVTSAKRPPHIYTFGGTAGYVQRFNRLELGVHGKVERSLYEDAKLISGATVDQSDRNFTAYGARLRGSYEVTPGIKPFVEAEVDRRVFDRDVDFGGVRRGSDGMFGRAGVEFGRERLLTGEASVGYAQRRYRDPALDDISGLIVDSSLVWIASGLTTVRLQARSEVGETRLAGASGVFKREASLAVEHAFRRWLIGTASVAYGLDEYRGADRRDRRLGLAGALAYRLSRSAALTAEVRHERLQSNVSGADYTANIVLVGLRLQR